MNTQGIYLWFVFSSLFLLMIFPAYPQTGRQTEEDVHEIEIVSINVIPGDGDNPHWVRIKWELTGGDPDGYIVVFKRRISDGGFDPLPDIIPYDHTEWIDEAANPSEHSEGYYVVVYDRDGRSLDYSYAHHTIFLHTVPHVDECELKITVRWDDYVITESQGAPNPLPPIFGCNEVLVSVDGGEETLVRIPITFGDVQYSVLAGLNPGSTYQFRVKACLAGNDELFSYSNPSDIIIFDPDWPEAVRLNWVSVSDGGMMQLDISSDGDYPDLLYAISRSRQGTGPFEEIVIIPLTASAGYEDAFADPDSGPWFYKVDVVNECDSIILVSDPVSGIFLQMEEISITEDWIDLDFSWDQTPSWSDYTLEYRRTQEEPFSPLTNQNYAAPGRQSLREDAEIIEYSGELHVRMAATDGFVSIHSNVVRITLEPEVTAPKAFRPNSHLTANQVFRPELNLTPASYEFRVYNRWQQLIFSSKDPDEAWDGTWKGEAVPEGVYAWVLEYQIAGGKKHSSMGSVMLVR
jgi:gliding motility-associated-like protein